MTVVSPDDPIVLSYVRLPVEHVEIQRQAARRLATDESRQPFDGWYLLAGIAAGALLYFVMYGYRMLVLIPLFSISPLVGAADLLIICFFPCLLAYAAIVLYLRRQAGLRAAAMRARVRPDLTVTVTISPQGASWSAAGWLFQVAWTQISAIELRGGSIEFDIESCVSYIPAHAFRNQQEQAMILGRIDALWQAGNAAKS